ncbi:MAG: hypothetical protein WD794_08520 [Mycobacteriales bacterium]
MTAVPDLVPARMVNEFAYCPRLFFLEWVQSQFEDSADTVDGRYQHRVVDEETGRVPPPESADQLRGARSVLVSAPRLGLIGRMIYWKEMPVRSFRWIISVGRRLTAPVVFGSPSVDKSPCTR